MKAPRLKRDWVGLKVITRRDMQTSMIVIPLGTECTVIRNYGGLNLTTSKCESCGVRMRINKVPESYVDIID